jgi:hypothetical protein
MGAEAGAMRTRLIVAGVAAWIGLTASLIVLAAAALAAFPGAIGRATTAFQQRPLAALGLGFALAVAAPIALVVLATTVIGLPLAFTGFAFYAAGFALAGVVICLWVGLTLRHRIGRPGPVGTFGQRLGWAAVGASIVMIVALVPLLGALAIMGAVLIGLGALAMSLWTETATA